MSTIKWWRDQPKLTIRHQSRFIVATRLGSMSKQRLLNSECEASEASLVVEQFGAGRQG